MVRSANERSRSFYVGGIAWTGSIILLVWLDLGVIAFCGSIFLAIWVFGLREKFSNEETASAYGVFNQDGKSIVGGFTASQFERQLRGRHQPTNNNNDNDDDPIRGPMAKAKVAKESMPSSHKVSNDERLRRRKAAVAAAEQRSLQQK